MYIHYIYVCARMRSRIGAIHRDITGNVGGGGQKGEGGRKVEAYQATTKSWQGNNCMRERNVNFTQAESYLLMVLNVHSNLLRLIRNSGEGGGRGREWGGGYYVLSPTHYTVTTRMTAVRRAAV